VPSSRLPPCTSMLGACGCDAGLWERSRLDSSLQQTGSVPGASGSSGACSRYQEKLHSVPPCITMCGTMGRAQTWTFIPTSTAHKQSQQSIQEKLGSL
jgi:hypothetical protein